MYMNANDNLRLKGLKKIRIIAKLDYVLVPYLQLNPLNYQLPFVSDDLYLKFEDILVFHTDFQGSNGNKNYSELPDRL